MLVIPGTIYAPARFGNPASLMVPAPFSPAQVSPDLWYDPSDLSTLFQSSGGTTAVAADADPVGYMGNKGGAGSTMNATQATSTKRPLYKTSGGLSWLLSDGVDDNLVTAGAISNIITASQYDIMIAAQFISISTNNAPGSGLCFTNTSLYSDVGGFMGMTARSTGPGLQAYNADGSEKVAEISGSPFATGVNIVARAQHLSGVLSLWVNNGTAVATASTNTGGTLTDVLRLFARGYDSGAALNCKFFGMVGRKTAFSTAEAANLWTWLGARAGLSL